METKDFKKLISVIYDLANSVDLNTVTDHKVVSVICDIHHLCFQAKEAISLFECLNSEPLNR